MISKSFVRFCKQSGFKLTKGQTMACSVAFDGAQPRGFWTQRETAAEMFACNDEISSDARRVVLFKKGRDVGGTRIGAIRLLHLGLTIPLTVRGEDGRETELLAPGEPCCGFIIAPDMRGGRHALRFVAGQVEHQQELRARVVAQTSDSITIRRDDKRVVIIEVIPASARGSASRGRSLFGVLLTEAAFFEDEDHKVNDVQIFAAVIPRVIDGGQVIIESTPWTEAGLVHQLFTQNFGHPVTCLAIHAPTLLMRDDAHTKRVVELESRRDPENALREFGAEFLSGGSSSFFDGNAIAAAIDTQIFLPRAANLQSKYFVGCDWAYVTDSSTTAVLERWPDDDILRVACLDELRPEKGAPLVPSEVGAHVAKFAATYGSSEVFSDRFYSESNKESLGKENVTLSFVPDGVTGKEETYVFARELLNAGKLRLPNHPRLLSQLRAIVATPKAGGGLSISSPRRAGGGHGDLVSALVASCWAARIGAHRTKKHPMPTNPVTLYHSPLEGIVGTLSDYRPVESGGPYEQQLLDTALSHLRHRNGL
jgi:hypothetical protein